VMLHRVVWDIFTGVLGEHFASIIVVMRGC
jgi:hypothetical protein